MAFSTFLDTFTAPTSAATDSTRTGYGFQPKAVIVWTTLATADGYQAGGGFSLGFASGSAVGNQRAVGFNMADNVATTDTGRSLFDGIVGIPATDGGSRIWGGRISSFDADGLTIDWTECGATGILVHILALGGADLTNAEVGDFAASTSTGNQAVSTGFQGDCVLFLNTLNTGTAPIVGTTARLGIGAATSSSARWAAFVTARDAQATTANVDAMKTQRSDSCIVLLTSTATQDALADFVSFDATPSFTINWSDAPAGANRMPYLLLKGGQYKVATFNKTTSAAPVDQDVTVGFTPTGLFLTSFNEAATTTITADCELSVGGGDGTREGSGWVQEKDETLNTEANCSIIGTKVLRLSESASTTDSEADHSFISNAFRLSWTTNLTSKADEIAYVAFGSTPAAGTAVKDLIASGMLAFPR